jgi:hypothetical protein
MLRYYRHWGYVGNVSLIFAFITVQAMLICNYNDVSVYAIMGVFSQVTNYGQLQHKVKNGGCLKGIIDHFIYKAKVIFGFRREPLSDHMDELKKNQ